MRKVLKCKRGFTLIELMVVVIIVGILAAVAIPLYRANVRKSMASEGAALLGAVLTAERTYYAEHGTYTTSITDVSTTG
ncbi:MAG TPA: prepilin-type N-terminal cleavage/methylation domain-containing protein, partial [bacterium]|nr:prepilin-type N-terminal cleavage/methylation domain-containing protein [bacterium]